MSDYDEGYRAGMQKMREVGQRRIEELEAENARLKGIVAQCRGMADQGIYAPTAAYRWCERIDEVCAAGEPLDEYEEWAWQN